MDGIYGNSGEIELTRAWGIYASWEQVWSPKWKTSIYGGWTSVSYNDNAKALIAASTCGNQAGAGNLLPAAFTTTTIANFPTQASGAITNFDLLLLSAKGSLYATRPTLGTYVAKRADLVANAAELFDVVTKGIVKINVNHTYALKDAVQAHRDLEARKTTGSIVLLP